MGAQNHLMGLICHSLTTKILQNFQSVFGSLMGMICHIQSKSLLKFSVNSSPVRRPVRSPVRISFPSFWISLKFGKMGVKIGNWGSEVKIGDENRFSFFFLFFFYFFRIWPHLGTHFWKNFDFFPGSQKL